MAKTILILTYFANQDGMACSHHIDVRLPVFKDCDAVPILLTSWCGKRHPTLAHYRVCSLSPSGLRFEVRQRFHKKVEQGRRWKILRDLLLLPLLPLYALERSIRRLDPTWSWYPLGVLMGLWVCFRRQVDTLYSTGGPPVVHAVGRTLSRLLALPWLAEVQDPLIHGYCARHPEEYRKLQAVEQATFAQATRMIFLTQEALKATAHRLWMAATGVVIYPGALPPPTQGTLSAGRGWRLAHFGSLGGVRTLQPLLTAAEEAVRRCPEMAEHLAVDLFGNVDQGDQERLRASPLAACFHLKGCIDHAAALAAMASYDLLLLIQGAHAISRETIPSKCYEYFLSGRPVLGLLYENEELAAMFRALGHHLSAADQPMAIAEMLISCYQDRQVGLQAIKIPSPYTVDHAVRQLLVLAPDSGIRGHEPGP